MNVKTVSKNATILKLRFEKCNHVTTVPIQKIRFYKSKPNKKIPYKGVKKIGYMVTSSKKWLNRAVLGRYHIKKQSGNNKGFW